MQGVACPDIENDPPGINTNFMTSKDDIDNHFIPSPSSPVRRVLSRLDIENLRAGHHKSQACLSLSMGDIIVIVIVISGQTSEGRLDLGEQRVKMQSRGR